MRFILLFLLTGFLAFVFDQFLPWWSVVLAGFLPALFIRLKGAFPHFLAAFLGAGLLWFTLGILSLYGDGKIIADRMAQMFNLSSGWFLAILAGLIAGLTAGFAAVTAQTFLSLSGDGKTAQTTNA